VLTRRHLVPISCAVVALATGGAGVVVSLGSDGWNTSGLVRLWDALKLAGLARRDDPTFPLRGLAGRYDGAYFYAVARDPLATGQAHTLVPEAPYYWGHPAYGWLAWLASGGGRPGAVPDALLAVGLFSIFVAGGAASLLAQAIGWSPWGGLVVALNPGLVFAVYSDTSEPLGAAVLLLALTAYACGRRGWAIGLLAVMCLDKEPLVLVPLAIAAWELWRTRRVSFVAVSVVPAALWWLYLRIHLGALPFGYGGERLTAPFLGWARALRAAAVQSWSRSSNAAQLGEAAVALIVVVGAAILVATIYALRLRRVVAPAFLALAALYACIAPDGVQYPKDLIREVALVLTLAPFVIAASPDPPQPAFVPEYSRRPETSSPRTPHP
jgi:hypothetical protein